MISKKIVFLAWMFICYSGAQAQSEIPLLTASSKKSTRPRGSGVVSAMELKVMKTTPYQVFRTVDDGVAILAGDELYKFNPEFQLAFKSDISNLLKFSELGSYTSVESDDKATYILEIKKKSKEKASVIHINPKGEARQQDYAIDINDNMDFVSFIVNGKLCILGKDIDKAKDKVVYKYYYINPADDKLTSKSIDLPVDDYEYAQIKKQASGNYYWRYLANHGDNVILIKSYARKRPGSKRYDLVCKLAEVDMQGNITNNKSITFEPKLAGDDREFVQPQIVFNRSDESLYLVGYMEIDKSKINGLYLLKYDYNTGALTYNKEYSFADLMKPDVKKNSGVHYAIPERIEQYYPLVVRTEDILIDKVNNFLNLRIITDFGFNNTTFFEVRFDKYGDHIKTVVTDYPVFINYYDNYVITPTAYQSVWADKSRPHVVSAKTSAWDFMYNQAGDKKSKLFWIPVSTQKGNSVIKYDSDEKKFTAVVLK